MRQVFAQSTVVATIEEHSVIGGLGGAVAEWLSDREPLNGCMLRIGTSDTFLHEAGDQAHARRQFDLTAESIARRVGAFYNIIV